MRKIFLAVVVMVLLGLIGNGLAQSGNDQQFVRGAEIQLKLAADRHAFTTEENLVEWMYFCGYVDGFVGGVLELGGAKRFFLLPPEIKDFTVYSVVAKWVIDHPEQWARGRGYMVGTCLQTNFPPK